MNDSKHKRYYIEQDFRDGYTAAGSAKRRKVSVGYVRKIYREQRRKIYYARLRRKLAMQGAVII